EARRINAGTVMVRTAQTLGALAVDLLEPLSSDGLATWNFFDDELKVGDDFPVLRLPTATSIHTGRVRPLAEERKFDKPITYEAVYGAAPGQGLSSTIGETEVQRSIAVYGAAPGRGLSFTGSAAGGHTWLHDCEHYPQSP